MFVIGLLWVVRYVEKASRRYEIDRENDSLAPWPHSPIWNPLDPDACYYGTRQKRLNQSVLTLISYSFTFLLAFLVLTQMGGCSDDEYELPGGGGEEAPITPQVRIKKIKRIKYVLNPLSAINLIRTIVAAIFVSLGFTKRSRLHETAVPAICILFVLAITINFLQRV